MAVAFGAVLVTAGCATAATQITDTEVDRSDRFDGGVEQLLFYCGKLRDSGELATAAGICERARSLAPTDARPLMMLGGVFAQMERLPQAASAYLAVLEQTPQNVEARYLLGKTYIAMGRHDLALQELQFALTQSPQDPRIYNALGIANGMLGNPAAAKQAFEAGLKVAPTDVPLRNNLGLALVLAGQHDAGIAVLQEVAVDPAATATTIRNLRLAQGIAQSARGQAAAEVGNVGSATMPGAAQIASTAAPLSDFGSRTEPVPPKSPVEPVDAVIVSRPPAQPAKPVAVAQEPVMLTAALSPLADGIQLAGNGAPVYLDSDSGAGDLEAYGEATETESGGNADIAASPSETGESDAATAEEAPAEDQSDGTDNAAEELTPASMPQPTLAAEYELPPGEEPDATGALQSVVTADADTAAPPRSTPRLVQTAALGGENVYAVQLASYRSADRAQDGWRQLRGNALDLLQDADPVIRRSDLGPEKGIYFRLRIKPSSKAAATQLCSSLQARGLSCLTIREDPATIEETVVPTAAKS